MKTIRKNSDGFTLIELLVVVAIIGLLMAIVMASMTTARAKARDARRLSDIRQIRNALELYRNSNNAYPTSLSVLAPTYIRTIPTDLSAAAACRPNYCYAYSINTSPVASKYQLGAQMETTSKTWQNDSQFNGSADYFNSFNGAVNYIYDINY